MKPLLRASGFLVALMLARAALALPVDASLELQVGDVHFLRINFVEAAEIDPPDLCTVERMPSLELVLTPRRVGTGLLFLFEEGRLEVYRLHIGSPKMPAPPAEAPTAAQWKTARSACPEVEERTVEGEKFLHLRIPDAACRAALLPLLATDVYPADHLRLVFEVPALQAQVGDMLARLKAAGLPDFPLGYEAATLALTGKMGATTRHKLLRTIWPAVVGRLDLDDKTEDPDGGGW
jgi:hypothetical protein